jgi:2-polyprenyl-3-methyl-5-hydroxy-6-metoxy-1,4-benzoquinol methylase
MARPDDHAIIRSQMKDVDATAQTACELEREDAWACDNCGSGDWTVYGVTLERSALHPLQCRCRHCGLVFTNPRVTLPSLRKYYRGYSSWFPGVYDPGLDDRWLPEAHRTLEKLRETAPIGTLLDVGSGMGAFLDLARQAGYRVSGVEFSEEGIQLTSERYEIEVREGTIEEAAFPNASFDVVHAWHVIEHVFDLDSFIGEIHRVLRPGGVVVIGTESYAYPANALLRASHFLRGQCPPAVTSPQHSFVFSPSSLADCFTRRGFQKIEVEAYDELSLGRRLAVTDARTAARRLAARAVVGLSELAARAIRRGPYLRASFRRLP